MAKRLGRDAVGGASVQFGAARLRLDASRVRQSRQGMIPGATLSHAEKLRTSHAVDLRDNVKFTPLPGGYVRVTPLDPTKRHR